MEAKGTGTGKGRDGQKLGFFELFIFLLSIYVLIAVMVDAFVDLDPQVKLLMQRIDNGVCAVFLWDFIWRFSRAPDKLRFMRWGWIDLISSLPAWNGFLWGRVVRLLRILRMIRAYRSIHALFGHLFRDFPRGAVASLGIVTVFLILFSSITVLAFEKDTPGANIHTGGDAIWWVMTTVTTVGYGDKVPVSTEGRILGIFLMIGGVGIFSIFTALIASQFVAMSKGENTELRQIERKLDSLHEEIRALKEGAKSSEEA